MRNKTLESLLRQKRKQSPVPDLTLPDIHAQAASTPIDAETPVTLHPVRRSYGVAAASVAAAVILCTAVVIYAQSPDGFPGNWFHCTDVSETPGISPSPELSEEPLPSPSLSPTLSHTQRPEPTPESSLVGGEIQGYDKYKTGLAKKAGLTETDTFRAEEPYYVFTIQTAACNMTGSESDTIVVYEVKQRSGSMPPESSNIWYDTYIVYVLVTEGVPVAYLSDGEIIETAYWRSELLPADFDGDGRDEIFTSSDYGGSGGCYYLSVIRYDGNTLVKCPIGEDGTQFTTLKAEVEPDGWYTMYSDATGYRERFRSDDWNLDGDESGQVIWDYTLEDGISLDPAVGYAVTDVDADGMMEIGITGAYFHWWHTGRCGHGVELWKYDPSEGRFHAIQSIYLREEELSVNPGLYHMLYEDLAPFLKENFGNGG